VAKVKHLFIFNSNNMRKFILKIIFFSIGLVGLIGFLLFLPYSPKTNKQMFIQYKKDSLLLNTISPRIIFIGGSNLSYGLNSQLIKDSLALNPINTSIHAGVGLKYMLRHTINYIKEGDTIIIAPEYHQFYGTFANGEAVLLPLLFEISYDFSNLDFKQFLTLSQFFGDYISSKLKFWNDLKSDKLIKNELNGLYSYNKYGDAYMHWSLPKPISFIKYSIGGDFNNEVIKLLIEFEKKIKEKNAHFFITFPCIAESSSKQGFVQIKIIEKKLKEQGFNILGTPERYFFNDSLIFNTAYHLTKEGVDLRTIKLIEDFKKAHGGNKGYMQ